MSQHGARIAHCLLPYITSFKYIRQSAINMRYITRDVKLPKSVDIREVDLRAFNGEFGPGMVLVNRQMDKLSLKLHRLNMTQFEDRIMRTIKHDELAKCVVNVIKSVKSYGYSNGIKQFVDYDKERKVSNRKGKSAARLAGIGANHATGDTSKLPERYTNEIICADSEQLLKSLPDNCIDIVFTSPPYNFGLEYDGGNDATRWEKYFDKLYAILDQCVRVLKHGGRIAINVQPLFSDHIPTHHVISNHLSSMGLIWKGEILWEKNNYNCKYTAWGSWKSPSSPYLKYTWEFIEVFCKGSLKKAGSKENADISADDFKKWVYAKWSIAPERNMKEFGHPAMFPEEVPRRVLQLFSFKHDIVLDPFAGVGTTCKVAKMLGRRYLGIDISDEYVRVAKKRITEMR